MTPNERSVQKARMYFFIFKPAIKQLLIIKNSINRGFREHFGKSHKDSLGSAELIKVIVNQGDFHPAPFKSSERFFQFFFCTVFFLKRRRVHSCYNFTRELSDLETLS